MKESQPIDGKSIGRVYDQQSSAYAEFADQRFAWKYLERPAFDRYIPDLYRPETRVLDIGCGTGVVERHLIERGVLPENIIGIDPSRGQLDHAMSLTPGVTFLQASADDFELPAGSVDLVITNTVIHHLDNEQLEKMLGRVYDVLSPQGCYFFVDVDPDHSAEGRDPNNTNKWTSVKTPWGTEVPFFNRDPYDFIHILDQHGFDKMSGWLLKVSPEGIEDPEYLRYASRPSRMAARYKKVPPLRKFLRSEYTNPILVPEKPEQRRQRELVEKYFAAWNSGSDASLRDIFSDDAVYDEKPGKREPLRGIEEIEEYWRENPVSQKLTRVDYDIVGHSHDGSAVWATFKGGFQLREESVGIEGAIRFATDSNQEKITQLKEMFITDKRHIPS